MSIAWESRSELFNTDGESDETSFQRHNECMKEFRLAHARVETIDSKRGKKADWETLVPLQKIRLALYFQN